MRLLLAAAMLLPAFAQEDAPLPPSVLDSRLADVREKLSETALGRKVLEAIKAVPVREDKRMWDRYIARYVNDRPGEQPYIGLRAQAWSELSERKLEFVLLHEGTHAALDLPCELFEGEQLAFQRELEYALQKAAVDKAFDRDLRELFAEYARLEGTRRTLTADPKLDEDGLEWKRYERDSNALMARASRDHLARVASELVLFKNAPGDFYWRVEQNYRDSPHYVGLQEVADFLDKYKDRIDEIAASPREGVYFRVGGRRYRWALVLHSRDVLKRGGGDALKARLEDFDGEGAKRLQEAIASWEKKGQP